MDKYEYAWMYVRNVYMPSDISRGEYLYEEIFKMNEEEMTKRLSISNKTATEIMSTYSTLNVDKIYEEFLESGAASVTIRDDEYPARLRYIDEPPYALFYYGDLPEEDGPSVAIIGARNCSEYGREMAENIAAGLGEKGVQVISGMAYGIDGISQMAAINARGTSYAILGCGVDEVYPRANKTLYERLKKQGGVISEYAITKKAKSENFPLRNRIISGLSDVVIVVEARLKSGTFITVDYALSQGREIMVVPGRATDPLSVGCNALLFQGANPVQSCEDVMRVLDTISPGRYYEKNRGSDFKTKDLKKLIPKQSEKILLEREENMVYSVLDFYALSPEDIAKAVNMDIFKIMSILIGLEMKGVIKETGKNLYVKCR